MFCPECGERMDDDALFCVSCGAKVDTRQFKYESNGLGFRKKIEDTYDEFKNLDYNVLIPIKKIFDDNMFSNKTIQWILFFGITPLIILYIHLAFNLEFENTSWLLGAYFCLIWAITFYNIIKPDRILWKTGISYALFTAFIGIPILFLFQLSSFGKFLYTGTESDIFIFQVLGFIFGVGVFEETCKILPLLLFGVKNCKKYCLKDGVFLGVMSGLGFAMAEAVQYTFAYWQGTQGIYSTAFNNYGIIIMVQIVRFMTLPLFHATWSGIAGWFCVVASFKKPFKKSILIVGILFVATLHGLYDVFASSILGILIGVLTIFIFMGYLSHSQDEYINLMNN